jgi:hypothetical protein
LGWRALVVPVLAGAGLGLAACGGGATAGPDAQWYRNGYNFGVDQQGSPSVQADSPTEFCNAALGSAAAAGSARSASPASSAAGSSGRYPPADITNMPRNVPPGSDAAGDGAWLAGCVAGLTSG